MATILGIDIREANESGAGKGRYTLELTKALIENAPKDLHLLLFTKTPNPSFPSTDRVSQVVVQGRGPLWHLQVARYLKRHPVDLFLAPTSFIYAAFAPKSQKVAIVVHDLIAFLYAKTHAWFPCLVERLTLSRAIRHSRFIVCVSQNTARDLATLFPEAHKKTVLIAPPAVSPEVHKVESQKMDLPVRYLLGVGTLSPRKNFQLLFKAFPEVLEKEPDLHIVLAGAKGWKTKQVQSAIPVLLKDRIHLLGFVSADQLNELYSRAEMLVCPSLYEGFGIPPLEAMACTCPVVSSNAASLPEVVGEAALLFDPHDAQALAQSILTALEPAQKIALQKLGLTRARHFSWKASAQQILKQLS
ncbi:MAG: glycosyltransferase family 1 protein [Candidatus Gracilibacteria bacterium]|jgi:glycosyltransferase involved in cell wall biosynthesis